MEHVFDVAIIGGGINGCGCAADAALRGLSVVLIEQDDLASKTSSQSSKLIHGGLRYLEHYDFSLVRSALSERQTLLELAPHLVHPLPIVLPYKKEMRPLWMLRIGLFIYDHLSLANTLPHSKIVHREKSAAYFAPLDNHLNKGFVFYDGATDDARLTIANALQAKEYGAGIWPRTKLIDAEVVDGIWKLILQPQNAPTFTIKTKSIINAAGPWVTNISQVLKIPLQQSMSLVKGSHLVVPKLYEGEHAYMLQHHDKRIVFVIPYHGFTMIGTTDVAFSGNMDDIHIEEDEITYLCGLINHYFNKKIKKNDIINTWSGIRPLLSSPNKTPSALSRDYAYQYSSARAPAVIVYGGKITTYRQLALNAVNQLKALFPHIPLSKTNKTPLPGAIFGKMDFKKYQSYARKKYAWLDSLTLNHYLSTYGTRTEKILANCKNVSHLGICFANHFYQVEIDYLLQEEWARNLDDILWRRTKMGLTMDAEGKLALTNYLNGKTPIQIFSFGAPSKEITV